MKKYSIFYLASLAIILLLFLITEILGLSLRVQMWAKLLIIFASFVIIPKIEFGRAGIIVIVALGLITILLSGATPDGKGFARTAIVFAMIVYMLPIQKKLLLTAVIIAPLWFVQEDIRSRMLEFTILLFALQMLALRIYQRPLLLWMFMVAYPVGMGILGYYFIYGNGLVEPTASNLARTKMIYAVWSSLPEFPFGYGTANSFNYNLSLYVRLFDYFYNDPHNLMVSAMVWLGVPGLIVAYLSFYRGIYSVVATKSKDLTIVFAASALCVAASTSTLSFVNVSFFIFLVSYISIPVRMGRAVRPAPA